MTNYELAHAGVKGMRWGVRRYQNKDGSLTPAGKKRYGDDSYGDEWAQNVSTSQSYTHSPSGPYSHAVTKNGVITVNRLMQMGVVGGLTFGAAKIAKRSGKKVLASALATIGTLSVTGLGAAMVTDFVTNDASDSIGHSELYHYGVLGQKWGVRRYQNKDGSLTPAGKKRYNEDSDKLAKAVAVKVEAIYDYKQALDRYKQAVAKNPKTADTSEVLTKAERTKAAYDLVNYGVEHLQKKYRKVDFDIMHEAETGESYVQSILEDDLGQKYVSEFYLGYHMADE